MKTTHTPGPWRIGKQNFSRDGRALNGELTVVGMQGPCDAIVCSLGADKEEVAANARLIAAAPDLLAALEMILDADGDLDAMDFDQARAALARAKG